MMNNKYLEGFMISSTAEVILENNTPFNYIYHPGKIDRFKNLFFVKDKNLDYISYDYTTGELNPQFKVPQEFQSDIYSNEMSQKIEIEKIWEMSAFMSNAETDYD